MYSHCSRVCLSPHTRASFQFLAVFVLQTCVSRLFFDCREDSLVSDLGSSEHADVSCTIWSRSFLPLRSVCCTNFVYSPEFCRRAASAKFLRVHNAKGHNVDSTHLKRRNGGLIDLFETAVALSVRPKRSACVCTDSLHLMYRLFDSLCRFYGLGALARHWFDVKSTSFW